MKSETMPGEVQADWLIACWKRTPAAASRSRLGVVALGYPEALTRSARKASIEMNRTPCGADAGDRGCISPAVAMGEQHSPRMTAMSAKLHAAG